MTGEFGIYQDYIKENSIKNSKPREKVLEVFLSAEKHLTIYDLYDLVKKEYPEIGQATIYRAMKVICDSGLADAIDIGDGIKRFEHKFGHKHHDHLICIKCGRIIEVRNDVIEELQEKMCKKYSFKITDHKLQIYGYCKDCKG